MTDFGDPPAGIHPTFSPHYFRRASKAPEERTPKSPPAKPPLIDVEERPPFRATCTCGWRGTHRWTYDEANEDARAHYRRDHAG